jgi:hypothetical protein
MGEAKKRRTIEAQKFPCSKPMNRSRFAILTMGTRMSRTAYMSEEISWWASLDERVLGLVAFDKNDRDYLWMILLRDRIGRFRCANLRTDFKSAQRAESELRIAMSDLIDGGDIEKHGQQGDETNNPIKLFQEAADQDPEKLHPYYKIIRDDPGHEPARLVLSELALWLAPSDPHLVREFQTAGFDQRIWEFYLWAAFKEFSLDVEQLEAPDFWCRGPGIDFTVEATTVGPSKDGALSNHPNPTTRPEVTEFLNNYMPLKFGSALMSKLNKTNKNGQHYWELDKASGKPFAIAVADFHASLSKENPGTMTFTQSALWQYLYGQRVYWEFEGDTLIIKSNKIGTHIYEGKEAPSGFFDLELANNVSAVIFSNAGTMPKFNRMGVAAGWHPKDHTYFRSGFRYNPDPDAIVGTPFIEQVERDGYVEWWTQEVQVFHNPNARKPLPFDWLLGATHHYFEDGNLKSFAPNDAVLSSVTLILKTVENEVA